MLKIVRGDDTIEVWVGTALVWSGSLSEWSRAIANPAFPQKAA
jgi:hypothetical protein